MQTIKVYQEIFFDNAFAMSLGTYGFYDHRNNLTVFLEGHNILYVIVYTVNLCCMIVFPFFMKKKLNEIEALPF